MGIDYGRKRVGIALSDGLRIAAHPYEVLESGPRLEDRLAEMVNTGDPHEVDHGRGRPAHLPRRDGAVIG